MYLRQFLLGFLEFFLNGCNHILLLFLILKNGRCFIRYMWWLLLLPLDFILELSDPGMQFLDNSLGEVGSLGEFILNLFVDLKLLPKLHDLSLQFFVLEDYLLSLLALVFQLAGELMVLKHGQPSSGLKFFFFEAEQVLPHFPDLVSHFWVNKALPSLILSVACTFSLSLSATSLIRLAISISLCSSSSLISFWRASRSLMYNL